MRKTLVAGNWKMYKTPTEAKAWFKELLLKIPTSLPAEAALMVPFPFLPAAQEVLLGTAVAYGAQDVSAHVEGAYTGETSVRMLADLTCKYTIVGHSERRSYHKESDALVAEKAKRLLEHGIIPILCVGEPLEVREAGNAVEYTLGQLQGSLEGVPLDDYDRLVVAYEPVWAIGTGKTATPEDAEAMHREIRAWFARRFDLAFANGVRILYGGSVKPDNAAALFAQPNVDGGLVGGASLQLESFLALLEAAPRSKA
ncbi:Triosephosphate isomerase [Calidithermus terrae]|uniref:Triosephosphate isomerase n=1 Tax=Calidithermus terrae TaxID=1408545 RepID=A0A399F789_9DEIN|nr:triose-phosphate isomerase [Calidithermus terrae]RIH90491.1 Triosephosphate isomerase [Calidithermus terrae]